MTNNALIAALGPDVVDAVHGYRLAVLAEAGRRRLCLVSHRLANRPLCYCARSVTNPPQLVPSPTELLDWAVADPSGGACPPATGQLDNNGGALNRLLCVVDPVPGFPPSVASVRTHGEE